MKPDHGEADRRTALVLLAARAFGEAAALYGQVWDVWKATCDDEYMQLGMLDAKLPIYERDVRPFGRAMQEADEKLRAASRMLYDGNARTYGPPINEPIP